MVGQVVKLDMPLPLDIFSRNQGWMRCAQSGFTRIVFFSHSVCHWLYWDRRQYAILLKCRKWGQI